MRYLFQVAARLDDRTADKVNEDLLDNQQMESYATKFNAQFQSNPEFAGLTTQTIRVVKSQMATIESSAKQALLRRGEVSFG